MGLIPAKVSFSYLFLKGKPSRLANNFIVIGMVIVCYILALAVPSITEAIVLVGTTFNPFIGFILPGMYYLKLDPQSMRSPKKFFAMVVMLVIVVISVQGIISFLGLL